MSMIYLLYLLIFIIVTTILCNLFRKWKEHKGKMYLYRILCFIFLIVQITLYKFLINYCTIVWCIFNPFMFLPLLISFILLIRRVRLFYLYLALFLLPFISLIVVDKIYELKFISYCKANLPQDELNAMPLSKEYFHTYNGEIKLNQKSIDPKKANMYLRDDLNKHTIYTDTPCSFITSEMEKSILKNDYIVVCTDAYDFDRNYYGMVKTFSSERIVGREFYFKKYEYKKSHSKFLEKILRNIKEIECSGYPWGSIIKQETNNN